MKKRLTDEQLIAALMKCGSATAAAEELGIRRDTFYERQRGENFQKLYAQARRDVLKEACAALQSCTTYAVKTLVDVMGNEETAPQVKINAADCILRYAARFTDQVDLLCRIEHLENEAENNEE